MFFILLPVNNEKPDISKLIDEHSKNLMKICYIYLKDHQLAEDAVQDTLLKAYQHYGAFKKKCREKTWITQIAINTCKDYLRKSSNKETASSEYIDLSFASCDETTAGYRDEDSICLLNAIYSLPEIYKQVILLYYYQDLRVNEISNILREKEGTISVRLNRAKDLLKNILKED